MQFGIVCWLIMYLKWWDPQEEWGGGGGAKKYVLENLLIKSCLADQVFCNTNHALQAS